MNDAQTNPSLTRGEQVLLLLAGLAALLALFANVAAESLDHGYTRYGAIAEHMVRTGDFVVPWLGDEIYILKPPLQSWLIALPIQWLGYVPNWVTHVPNLLGAAASMIATWFLARRLLGDVRLATLASLVLATFASFVEHARGERVDPLFADSLVTAMAFFHAALFSERSRSNKLLIATWLSLVVGLYTKGPFAPLFFLAVAIPYSLSLKRGSILLRPASLLGAALALGLFAVWPILLIDRIGLEEAARLYRASVFAQLDRDPLFYLTAIPSAIAPWTLFLPAFVAFLWRIKPWRDAEGLRLPVIWIAVIVVLLHASSAKAERYLLPLLAPTSILIVAMFARAKETTAEIVRITGVVGSALLALYALASPFLRIGDYGVLKSAAPIAIVGGALAVLAFISFLRTREHARPALTLALSLLLTLAARDVTSVRKLRKLDGRDEAVAALAPILASSEVGLVGVDSATQGMLEMIVRHDLPRYSIEHMDGIKPEPHHAPSYLLIHVEDDSEERDIPSLVDCEIVSRLHLDELDYVLVRAVRLASHNRLERVTSF